MSSHSGKKAPLRRRNRASRNSVNHLVFMMWEVASMRQPSEVKWHMLRAKLMAWKAIYGMEDHGKQTDSAETVEATAVEESTPEPAVGGTEHERDG